MEDLRGDVDKLCQEFEELRPHISVPCLRYAITKTTRVASKMADVADTRERMLHAESKCSGISDAAVTAFNSWIQSASRADKQRATGRFHEEVTGPRPADGVLGFQVSFACDAIAAGVPVEQGEMDAVAEAHIAACWVGPSNQSELQVETSGVRPLLVSSAEAEGSQPMSTPRWPHRIAGWPAGERMVVPNRREYQVRKGSPPKSEV